jgi:hypothetical protein
MVNFYITGDPYKKKTQHFFYYRDMKIHTPIESTGRVDKKCVGFKNFSSDFWPSKSPKKSVKIRMF